MPKPQVVTPFGLSKMTRDADEIIARGLPPQRDLGQLPMVDGKIKEWT